MKIITKYILGEHVGPFTFAFTALTSLMLLNFISRQLKELIGKGLPMSAIWEFLLLSIPFTVALTVPMSVLVAVLYAFSRLAAENEVTALKASGVSPWRVVFPSLVWGLFMSLFLLAFNDQVLPRTNHRLKTLQEDISQTKPTFLLKEQVINSVAEGKFYLKAGKIDRSTGSMREVVIHDLANPMRRRTIYADSGTIGMSGNRRDIELDLYQGEMHEVSTDKPGQLNRLFYTHDVIRIKDVAGEFEQSANDSSSRGDRELGVCAMQKRLQLAENSYFMAKSDHDEAVRLSKLPKGSDTSSVSKPSRSALASVAPEARGIGWAYCQLVTRLFGVKVAEAAVVGRGSGVVGGGLGMGGAELSHSSARPLSPITDHRSPITAGSSPTTLHPSPIPQQGQDTTRRTAQDSARRAAQDSARRDSVRRATTPAPSASTPAPGAPASLAPAQATPSPAPGATGTPGPRVLIGGQLIDPRTGMPVVVPPGQQPMPGTVPGAQQGVVLGATPGVPGAQSPPGVVLGATPVPGGVPGDSIRSIQEQARQAAAAVMERDNSTDGSMATARIADAKFRLDIATVQRNRYQIEIHKKFSLALACLVFVILGAPMALRFQRGGVGLVFLVSLAVFALYYVGLIGGEALANKGIIPPFWSMWGMNVFLATVGMVLLFRMGREENSGRGGGLGERVDRWRDAVRARRSRRLVKEPA